MGKFYRIRSSYVHTVQEIQLLNELLLITSELYLKTNGGLHTCFCFCDGSFRKIVLFTWQL